MARSLVLPARGAKVGWRLGMALALLAALLATLVASPDSAAAATTFANTGSISIPDYGAANPYPSNIVVSGMCGTISKLTVTLRGLSHTYPDDIDMLLAGPAGQSLVLFSNVGEAGIGIDAGDATNLTIVLDDAAAGFLPDNSPPGSGTFKPTDHSGSNDFFPEPASTGPYGTPSPTGTDTLASVFNGAAPNGTWALYVTDDSEDESGTLSGGWELTITTAGACTTLVAADATGTYGGTTTLRATLTATSGGAGISGKLIAFTLDSNPVGTAFTNASGVAEVTGISLGTIGVSIYPGTVRASFAGDGTHDASSGTAHLFVNTAGSATTVTAPDATYTGSPYTGASATATGVGGLSVPVTTFSYRGRNSTVYAASSTPPTNAGDYTATATYAGNANHTGSTGDDSFTIGKATQSITFLPDPLPARAFGTAPFRVSATASSRLTVSFTAGPDNVCMNSGTLVTIVGVGTCTVTATQAGNGNYLTANAVDRRFQVTQAVTTTTARGSATYGNTTVTLSATITSGGSPVPTGGAVTLSFNGQTYPATTNAQGMATATAPLPPGMTAGNYANRVRASYAGTAAYAPNGGSGPLVVARRILWVKPADQTVGLRQPTPTTACTLELANGSAFINGDSWAAVNLANLRCAYNRSGNGPATEKVGAQYRITAADALSTNYDIRYQTGILTVR